MPPSSRREPTIEMRRHRRTDGSESELWSVRWYDAQGRRRRRSCGSREEADFERARLALNASRPREQGSEGEEEPPTLLREFWPLWLADARSRLQPETARAHERVWAARLQPAFGDEQLRAIKPRMVARWRAELLEDGLGVEAVRKAMVLLQAIFSVAIEWGEADANPVSVVRKPRQGRRRVVIPLAPEDVERIRAQLLAAGDLRSATLVSVLAYAGLRPGEALGLELRHVRENTLLVEQAVAHGRLKVQKTGRNYRTVDLFDVLRGDLAAWTATLPDAGPRRLIFGRPDGDPWHRDDWTNWRNRRFHPVAAAAGLGRPRPYDLRHSFASLLIREQRASIVELAEQLGHAPTMTLDTYSHVMAEHRRTKPVDVEHWITRARHTAQAEAAAPKHAQDRPHNPAHSCTLGAA